MRDSRGFIYFNVLMLVLLILLTSLAINNLIMEDIDGPRLREAKLELFCSAENKLLLAIYDQAYQEDFIGEVSQQMKRGNYRNLQGRISIDREDLSNGNTRRGVEYSCLNRDARFDNTMIFESDAKIDNISSKARAEASFINPIFMEKGFVSHREHREDYGILRERMERDWGEELYGLDPYIEGLEIYDSGGLVRLMNYDSSYYLEGEETNFNFDKSNICLIIGSDDFPASLSIDRMDLELEEDFYNPMDLAGIIYVSGNLYINQDLNFQGLIIVDGKVKIHSEVDVDLGGALIARELEGDLNIDHRLRLISKYGVYIPGFIDPRIISIYGS